MHTDLVRASGLEAHADECEPLAAVEHLEVRDGALAGRGVQRHPLAVPQMPADGGVDGALVLRQRARQQRQVRAADVATLHGLHQPPVGFVAASHDEEPRCVLVEPVDDAGAHLMAPARALGHEPLSQSAVFVARRRMDDHPRRLVDHQQPVVLVDDT